MSTAASGFQLGGGSCGRQVPSGAPRLTCLLCATGEQRQDLEVGPSDLQYSRDGADHGNLFGHPSQLERTPLRERQASQLGGSANGWTISKPRLKCSMS